MTDVYNPFCLFNAFFKSEIANYWFDSATPSAVIEMLSKMPPITLADIENVACLASYFGIPFDSYQKPLPVLYQSGYLTIKDYDRDFDEFVLGLPNAEVRRGFANILYQHIMTVDGIDTYNINLRRAYFMFRRDNDLPAFIDAIKVFFAGIPYHLAEHENGRERKERHYHVILYTLLVAFGADIWAEEATAKGRSDIVLKMPKRIYIVELKVDDTAENVLAQIDQRGYADKYRLDGRPITKVGTSFSSKERNITDYHCS